MTNIVPGYDAQAAEQSVYQAVAKDVRFKQMDAQQLRALVRSAIALDGAYMQRAGVADGDYYDEDEAYESIVDGLVEQNPGMDELLIAELVDAYLDAHQQYLEDHDLVEWD